MLKQCPNCRTMVASSMTTCPACHRAISDQATLSHESPEVGDDPGLGKVIELGNSEQSSGDPSPESLDKPERRQIKAWRTPSSHNTDVPASQGNVNPNSDLDDLVTNRGEPSEVLLEAPPKAVSPDQHFPASTLRPPHHPSPSASHDNRDGVEGHPHHSRVTTQKGRTKMVVTIAGIVAVVCALGAIAVLRPGGESGSGGSPRTASVALLTLGASEQGAFTKSVSKIDKEAAREFADANREAKVAVDVSNSTLEEQRDQDDNNYGSEPGATPSMEIIPGDSHELYGIDPVNPVCDVPSLARELVQTADDAKREKWSDAMQIDVSEIENTLESFAPALLANDALMVRYSYMENAVHKEQVLIEGGSPVLVDDVGVPRVQCETGNPLMQTELTDETITYTGDPWSSFSPSDIVKIVSAENKMSILRGYHVKTGEATFEVVGNNRAMTGYLIADESGIRVLSDDGASEMVFERQVARVFNDSRGGVVFQNMRSQLQSANLDDNEISTTDLEGVPPANKEEGTIWHLPAGAVKPVALLAPQDFETASPVLAPILHESD